MTRAYFAVIDPLGLRALKPESVAGARAATALRDRLDAAVYWVIVPGDATRLLQELLDSAEFRTALVLLVATAEHYGPVLTELHDLASARDSLAA